MNRFRLFSVLAFLGLSLSLLTQLAIGQQSRPTPDDIAVRTPTTLQPDFEVSPGDAIIITVFDTPELSGTYRISGSGYILFPLIGQINISGKSTSEIAQIIREQLVAKKLLIDPQVSASLADFTNHSVTILGEVAHPGSIPLTSSRLLWDVVGAAGGVTPAAGTKVIILNKRTSQVRNVEVDWSSSIDGQPNPAIEAGDTIQIPVSGYIYVVGQVNRQAAIPITRNDAHVSAVVAAASGLMQTAKASHARLIRRNADGTKVVAKVDINAILKGTAQDIVLRPNDIIYVPYNLERAALARGVEAAVSIASSLALFAVVQ